MKVLVTGGFGYIGSHCSVALLEAGYDIVVMDSLVTGHGYVADVLRSIGPGKFLGIVEGDLLSQVDIQSALGSYGKIDAVVHFAALSQVSQSVKEPTLYYRNNTVGTLNLLDELRSHGVDKIVFSSTAAVYGETDKIPISEDIPKIPINPYGRSKLMIESMMDDFSNAYGLRSVRLRYFNVAGADSQCRVGEWHDPETHLVPNVLKKVLDGKKLEIFGTDYDTPDGTCIRDYVNVEDLADAHVLALKYLESGGRTDFFNIGTKTGSSVKEIVSECERAFGKRIEVTEGPRRPGDPAKLVADNSKAREVLGWEPKRSLGDSVTTALAWERKMRVERQV